MQNTHQAGQIKPPSFTSRGMQTEPETATTLHGQTITTTQYRPSPRLSSQHDRVDATQPGATLERRTASVLAPGLNILTEELTRLRTRLDEVVGERDSLLKLIEKAFPAKMKEAGATSSNELSEEMYGQGPVSDVALSFTEGQSVNQVRNDFLLEMCFTKFVVHRMGSPHDHLKMNEICSSLRPQIARL